MTTDNRVDDEEAVTVAWLISDCSFRDCSGGVKRVVRQFYCDYTLTWYIEGWLSIGGVYAPCRTRGEFRRLAECLGIALREEA